MIPISKEEIEGRFAFENPWWEKGRIDEFHRGLTPRVYLRHLSKLVGETTVQRAVVLMGPRRVGKTVMLYHEIQVLLTAGVDPNNIFYVSLDSPVYIDQSLEKLTKYYMERFGRTDLKGCYVFFDEIQYLKNWEVHLKKLVEEYRETKFIASGSAAAALRLRSNESGAGRFSNFILPPLTFQEFLRFRKKEDLAIEYAKNLDGGDKGLVEKLNAEFVGYLNYGGYPEAISSPEIQSDPQRYIRSDIIDKVLLRDLPALYGIQDIQELNRLFTMLAYNSGGEVSLDQLAQGSGVAKNTIKRYLEYLEAAFLITSLHRIDQAGKRFKRANYFKVYLTNPSMRCALFGPVSQDHPAMGAMVETAIIAQWMNAFIKNNLFYARWAKGGEVDLVYQHEGEISWCVEVKWSDRYYDSPGELASVAEFVRRNPEVQPIVTTRTRHGSRRYGTMNYEFNAASYYCYLVGKNTSWFRTEFDNPLMLDV